MLPPDPSRRAPQVAIVRVAEELRHRELKIQAELIALRPVVGYVRMASFWHFADYQ